MISILDTIDIYLSKNYNERIRDYKCNEGNILYFNDKRNDHIVIHTIFLYKEYRRKRIFTNLINKIINNYKEIKYICVICPSLPLSTYLMTNKFDDRYFRNLYTGEFSWVRKPYTFIYNNGKNDVHYDHEKSTRIAKKLSNIRKLIKDYNDDQLCGDQLYDELLKCKLLKYF